MSLQLLQDTLIHSKYFLSSTLILSLQAGEARLGNVGVDIDGQVMLEDVVLRVLKVFEGTLGTDVEATLRVICPAVEAAVPVVVRVRVGEVLRYVVVLALKPVLGLQGLRVVAGHLVVNQSIEESEGGGNEKHGVQGNRYVLLGHLAVNQEALHTLEESLSVHRLHILVSVVHGQTMVFHNALEDALHRVSRHF